MGICKEPLSVVTEYLEGGSLCNYLEKDANPLNEENIFQLILGISRGMFHLHLENIVHRDLASRNVLLTSTLQPKISDFVIL